MSSETSEQMMALLQELSKLKELKRQSEANPSESDREAERQQDRRREEITQEIKALGEVGDGGSTGVTRSADHQPHPSRRNWGGRRY